ncbi:hypothetical protein Tco_0645931 [Tanacetum coccineum]
MLQAAEQDHGKEKLNKKMAKLSGGGDVAVKEGIVVGGGCTLLRLAAKMVDLIRVGVLKSEDEDLNTAEKNHFFDEKGAGELLFQIEEAGENVAAARPATKEAMVLLLGEHASYLTPYVTD